VTDVLPIAKANSLGMRIVGILRLARLRMLVNKTTPFLVGVLASKHGGATYFVLGFFSLLCFQVVTSISNCVSDRVEDTIDCPERSQLCEAVGHRVLLGVVGVTTVLYLSLAGYGLAINVPPATVAVGLAGLIISFAYSFMRLKTHPLGPPGLLGAMSAVCLWAGWHGPGTDPGLLTGDAAAILPSVLTLWLLGATLCGSKDAPNLEGDAAVGYESVYVKIVKGRRPFVRVLSIVSLPYLFVVCCVSTGYTPPYLWIVLLYPMAIAFAKALVGVQGQDDGEVMRELGYLYWQIFMSAVLLALYPTAQTGVILVGSIAWWFASSCWLHPDPYPNSRRNAAIGARLALGKA
jgi:4-hydroxybenzoate polyprenyltransferase